MPGSPIDRPTYWYSGGAGPSSSNAAALAPRNAVEALAVSVL